MANQPTSYHNLPLLPNRFRYVGFVFLSISFATGWLYFFGGRPAIFEIPVFAVVTSYIETRWFVLAQTNILDEIAVITMLTGLIFVAFSREKSETNGVYLARIKSFIYGVYGTVAICSAIYLTVFGWPAAVLLSAAFVFFLVIYIVLFRLLLLKNRVEVQHQQHRKLLKKGAL